MRIAVLDIGGTAIKFGIWEKGALDNCGEREYCAKLGTQELLGQMREILRENRPFDRIGISTAGLINSDKGVVMMASNIVGYSGTDLRKILGGEFNVPVFVENDVNCAAIAEAVYGAGQSYDSFICLAYGTGIGGAIIKDRQVLHRGANFAAGEMGHMITHAEDKLAGDVRSGCYEMYASTTALVKLAQKYDETLTSGRKIFAKLDSDENLRSILDKWIVEVMVGLAGLIHTFDPPCVVLGGGIMAQKYIIDKLCDLKADYIMPTYCGVVFKPAQLGNYTGLLGAGYLAATMVL
ncbi:MAG: ROK family protein [Oscillospiraceae bacterium]